MFKKMKSKKGFTIVELVIVIAVIAILAAVLIPTFVTVVDNANESAALQTAKTSLTHVLAEIADEGETLPSDTKFVVYDDANATTAAYVFVLTNGELGEAIEITPDSGDYTLYTADGADAEADGTNFTGDITPAKNADDTNLNVADMSDKVEVLVPVPANP